MTTQPSVPVPYVDNFNFVPNEYGCTIDFGHFHVTGPGQRVNHPVLSVGMTLEHAKVMAFILVRELLKYENGLKSEIKIFPGVLQGITTCKKEGKDCKGHPEEWERFWNGWKTGKSWGPAAVPSEVLAPPVAEKPALPFQD